VRCEGVVNGLRRSSDSVVPSTFERVLRVGPKTVVRWERGTVFQNRATDTLLRMIRDVPAAREYLMAGAVPRPC
jgi:DNA-binding transcriptional regulator YiaG